LKNNFYSTLIIIFSFVTAQSQNNWISFRPIEGDFQVNFPGLPDTKEKDLHTEIGVLKTTSYNVKLDQKSSTNFLYSVNLVVYPDETFNEDSIEYNHLVMQNSVSELSRLLKCSIVYISEQSLNNKPALTFRLMDELSGQVVKGVVVRNLDTIYTVNVFTMKDKSLNDDIDKFLSSFSLIE
jgi:hypothetical protein